MGVSFCCTSARTFADADDVPIASSSTSALTWHSTKSKPKATTNGHVAADEPYSATRADELFASYADEDSPDVISPEGFGTLCENAAIAMDGALPLILSWLLDATEMGQITRAQWKKGTAELQ